jgi:hypothetical protein
MTDDAVKNIQRYMLSVYGQWVACNNEYDRCQRTTLHCWLACGCCHTAARHADLDQLLFLWRYVGPASATYTGVAEQREQDFRGTNGRAPNGRRDSLTKGSQQPEPNRERRGQSLCTLLTDVPRYYFTA